MHHLTVLSITLHVDMIILPPVRWFCMVGNKAQQSPSSGLEAGGKGWIVGDESHYLASSNVVPDRLSYPLCHSFLFCKMGTAIAPVSWGNCVASTKEGLERKPSAGSQAPSRCRNYSQGLVQGRCTQQQLRAHLLNRGSRMLQN